MSFTLDCNHRDVISKKKLGEMALHYTNVQMLADTCMDKPAHILACGLRTRPGSFLMSLLDSQNSWHSPMVKD